MKSHIGFPSVSPGTRSNIAQHLIYKLISPHQPPSFIIDDLKQTIRQMAADLGFDECRFAKAQPAAHAERLDEWLEEGCHGDMDWMAKTPERRKDPRQLIEDAKTVIALVLNYHQKAPASPADGRARGRFAQYAWGRDYHDIIEKKLNLLSQQLNALGGTQRRYVDYGPVLERDFATAAGIGWNGKSTVQIHRKFGTWFFLAELVTTLEIEPDAPSANHCGKCTACIDVCPTQAITAPHRMDARRCISYLTIEHQGSIPEEFREAIGDRIFGCDECLTVCPWNRFAQESRETNFAVRDYVHNMTLTDFLRLTDAEFRELFSMSPVKRLKRPRFLRNVCVALGNTGTHEDLPALRVAATDPDPLIAEHAQWGIDRILSRHPEK